MNKHIEELSIEEIIKRLKTRVALSDLLGPDELTVPASVLGALLARLEAAEKEISASAYRIQELETQWENRAPTPFSYEAACSALNVQRERAEAAEARLLVPVKLPKRIQWSYDGCVPKSEVYAFNSGIDSCEITIRAAGFLVEGDYK